MQLTIVKRENCDVLDTYMSSYTSILHEYVIVSVIQDEYPMYQFTSGRGHSNGLCISVLRSTV